MKIQSTLLTLAFVVGLAMSSTAPAQGNTSSPVGFSITSLLANSDTLISIPLLRPAEFSGTVASVAGSTITVSGTPGWVDNQFVYLAGSQPKTYFVSIGGGGTSNPKEGHIYTITGNGANTLTVNTATDSLSGITANTQLTVIPYWTLGTIFPAANMNISFTPTVKTPQYKTQVLVPNNAANGINLPSTTYFFSNNVNRTTGNVGWRVVGDIATSHDDDPLTPNSYIIIRNQNGAPTLPVQVAGHVLTGKVATGLRTLTNRAQDTATSMVRPVSVTLNQTGLSPADGSFVATTKTQSIKDQLLLFDNTQVGINKQPSATYYYYAGTGGSVGWKLLTDGLNDHGSDPIAGGGAVLIRKAKTTTGATVYWTNTPTY